MTRLDGLVPKIRSKNAGPFWLTIDLFCDQPDVFERVSSGLSSDAVAAALQVDPAVLKRFDIADLHVVKFSVPRPQIQGTRYDRDMHGASFAYLLGPLKV